MKIGIASGVDIRTFRRFFKQREALIIIENCYYPNIAPAVNTLILSFLQEGHYICLFTLSKQDFNIHGEGIDIYGIKAEDGYPIKYLWGDFINAKKIRKVMSSHISGLDLIHAHWTYTYAYASGSFAKQLPVFCTVRDWASYIWKIESLKNKVTWCFRWLMNKRVFKNRNIHFIANSSYTASLIRQNYKLETPIVPNPIKESFLICGEHTPPSYLKILCISSSNDRRKNVKTLLLAFRKILAQYTDAELQLIGPPFTPSDKIIQSWQREGLLKQVSLLGSVDHDALKKYFYQTTMFVTPSLEETFGNTLLEAMARKVPIVAGQDSGAIPYVLQQGKAGFLCNVADDVALAEAINYVYSHPAEAKLKTDWAYQYLQVQYIDTLLVEKHIQLYNKYIGNGTKSFGY